ncbi:hypothetical protein CSUI_001321 [Cystoisospora suis]|uniref:Uncharacterized protein n=1 Tax=Cystoisospora suis TaxID=483139 RepID=A0A2C6LDF5_9APIC|nr:hypothetical protein CSUI_001321 [Cystoisospora suis]
MKERHPTTTGYGSAFEDESNHLDITQRQFAALGLSFVRSGPPAKQEVLSLLLGLSQPPGVRHEETTLLSLPSQKLGSCE